MLLLLALCEFGILSCSMFVAAHLRLYATPDQLESYSNHLLSRSFVFGAMIVLGMAAMGLYQIHLRESWFGLIARQIFGFVIGAVGLMVVNFLIPQFHFGRGVVAIAMGCGFVLVTAFRAGFMRIIDADLLKRRVLIVGAGSRAAMILQRMRRRTDRRGFTIVGFVARPGEVVAVPHDRLVQVDGPLCAWTSGQQIDEIVVGPDDRRGIPMEDLLDCKQAGLDITELATFFEREAGKVKIELAEPSWLVFSLGFDVSPIRRLAKRGFDLCFAAVVLGLAWPLMLLVAVAIRLESGRGQPILYRQERVGEHRRIFVLTKFRSMCTDAERDGVARWASKSDDRVTRVGRFIRRARLDELPQLWNILRGDMSLVGPRPERPQFVEQLSKTIRYYNLRHCVKPGLAGWAQLRYPYGSSEADAAEKLKYDLFYVKNRSMLLDMMILIQTAEVVLFGRGAR
jgi:sugar transferase (PEP-CTERM system associated)